MHSSSLERCIYSKYKFLKQFFRIFKVVCMSLKYLFSKSAISKQHSRNFEIIKGSTVGLRNSLMKVKIVNVTIA